MNDSAAHGHPDSLGIDASAGKLRCAPLPAWVSHAPWAIAGPGELEAYTDNGLLRVLHDTQVSLSAPGYALNVRAVQRVLTRAGAERAAHVALEFDPAHESLEIHAVRIWRGAECIEHARVEAFQILRRETQLERLALNGRLTATLLIPDVRVEDLLEVCFTQRGGNPVLSGRFAGWISFNQFAPWAETRFRLLRPLSRYVQLKDFNAPPAPSRQVIDGVEDTRWSLAGQARRVVEELLTPWTVKTPCCQLTEFATWGEVVEVFEPLYRGEALPAEIATQLADIAARCPQPAERAVEWLRFVQRELRYFALSLGDGGLVPRPLELIWGQRFGDCKDATRLFIAGARQLGLDACAALVSTIHGLSLGEFLPSVQIFNHAIARLRLNDATYWLDPTLQRQGGQLDTLMQPHVGFALPLAPGTTALATLPAAQPLHHLHCEDEVQLGPKTGSTATLRRRIDFRHWTADAVRHRIANEGGSKLSDQMLRELQSTWPALTEASPMALHDDLAANHLSALFTYEIREAWKHQPKQQQRWVFAIADAFLIRELNVLNRTQREADIFLGRPRKATWRAQVRPRCEWSGNGWHHLLEEPGLRFSSELVIDGGDVRIQRELLVSDWSLAAQRAGGYADIVARLRANVTQLWGRVSFGRVRPLTSSWLVAGGSRWRWLLIAIWLLMILAGLLGKGH